MIGITAYGTYVPHYRLKKSLIYEQMGWFNEAYKSLAKGEKAVANVDEDAITMAYASSNECTKNVSVNEKNKIEGLFMGSLCFPFRNRRNSTIVAKALNLNDNIRTIDFSGSINCGVRALLQGIDSVISNSLESVLISAADCRAPQVGSSKEYTYGDGAASLLIGNENVIAEYKGNYTLSSDFMDIRQMADEKFEHEWEGRWVREEGYLKLIPNAVSGFLAKYNIKISDFNKIIISCPNESAIKKLVRILDITEDQIFNNKVDSLGDTGSAQPIIMLSDALEMSMPGDKLLLVSYGYGCDVIAFEATNNIADKKGVFKTTTYYSNSSKELDTYARYLIYKNLIYPELGIRGETTVPTSLSLVSRKGSVISALVGAKCKVCGTIQYPDHRVCVNPECRAIDQMEQYEFANRKGKVVSYTGDNLAFSLDPPQIYGLIDFPEGGRLFLDFTDCLVEELSVGLDVEMTFRRKYVDKERAYIGYYWKAKPTKVKESGGK